MAFPLFKKEMKSCSKLLLLFLAIVAMYSTTITAMYDPSVGEGMNELAKSMPDLFSAFGMQNPGTSILDFLVNYLYGFILILIPMIFSGILCFKLLSKYIDNGSMAYLLNSSYSRISIVVTQLVVALIQITILIVFATVLTIVCAQILFPGELDIQLFLKVNLALYTLHLFLLSMFFLFACIFNELKYANGLTFGLGLLFILVQMLSQMRNSFEFLKYMTPLSLFEPSLIIQNDSKAVIYMLILTVISLLFFVSGITVFKKRDLPL